VLPGSTATFTRRGDVVHVEVAGSSEALDLPSDVAAHIFVSV
jgi:DtxR family Mn-dependent transcriptional regulator